jgi:outer membrane protein assembly factor BamB
VLFLRLIQKVRFLPIKVNSALGRKVTKDGLSSGVEAADGIVIVGNQKGQFFALDQATGAKNGLHNCLVQLSVLFDSIWTCDYDCK